MAEPLSITSNTAAHIIRGRAVQPTNERESAFYQESLTRVDEVGSARKTRICGSQSEIPGELWVLLLDGGMVMLLFVPYLTFAMERPFVGSIAVSPEADQHVLDTWSQLAAKQSPTDRMARYRARPWDASMARSP
ncbi:bestrophin-like domain [Mycolicibacterium sarraceniae]|uniref:bestrophin-like domain n=1 Tax=Mycolicibacterium sarraceniae TaxID=1534348 RepID=UPI0013D88A90|nr:hypothetical protein [Mycolicibacterium sarraceniae]